MTVTELIEKLKEMPPDLPVMISDKDSFVWGQEILDCTLETYEDSEEFWQYVFIE